MTSKSMQVGKPLRGVKVLEVSRFVTASMATTMLADQGAEVIKVEDVKLGDQLRYAGTRKGDISALFANVNRGKRSIAVDLQTPEGQEIVRSIAERSDVFIHNFRPGVTDRLNLGSDALRQLNRRLIYVAVTGFGIEGPLASAPAFDQIMQAISGFTATQSSAGKPALVKSAVCDKLTAYTACQAVTAALLERYRTGEGQHIEVPMLDACLYFMWPDGMINHTLLDDDVSVALSVGETFKLFPTSDGAVAIAPTTDAHVEGLLEVAKRRDLLQDPRFATSIARGQNTPAMMDIILHAFADRTSNDVCADLARRDVPCAACLDIDAVISQPQVQATKSVARVRHPHLGEMNVMSFPIHYGGRRIDPTGLVPAHGEHTAEILVELGFSDDQLRNLVRERIVKIPGRART